MEDKKENLIKEDITSSYPIDEKEEIIINLFQYNPILRNQGSSSFCLEEKLQITLQDKNGKQIYKEINIKKLIIDEINKINNKELLIKKEIKRLKNEIKFREAKLDDLDDEIDKLDDGIDKLDLINIIIDDLIDDKKYEKNELEEEIEALEKRLEETEQNGEENGK